ncbi:DNA-binding protein [Cryobacterium adonitolivorans]|uniref:DNA-binding protein n=1 Tax=Cryobacterium adonitolivorans TaxID=1259189 RepID=A0A4R8W2H8_9MICO|nr:DNA-binding protein [Cryobacterium adonitolivorans]TFC00469.1 DNA-binding protein [Cryobacterium adonitolivorans]
MFVITADQIDSRHDRDRASDMINELMLRHAEAFMLPPDQTSGDEIQLLVGTAADAFAVVLDLHRTGFWSVGVGIGPVRTPLPATTRQATGDAFIAARAAVTRAKRSEARFALDTPPAPDRRGASTGAEVEALVTMLLLLRQRRSNEGWEAVDLLESGLAQTAIARTLGISTAAVSQRVKSAQWKVERAAHPALVRLLDNLDSDTLDSDTSEMDGLRR